MYLSGSGKEVEFERIPQALLEYYERNKKYGSKYSLIVGTDSQNYADRKNKTKIVTAICYLCEGHGGIYFAEPEYVPILKSVRQKLHAETARSLDAADSLLDAIMSDEKYAEMYLNTSFSLNIDAGYEDSEYRNPQTHSKTESLIPELVAWVNAMGFDAYVKPDSVAASCVADRISK